VQGRMGGRRLEGEERAAVVAARGHGRSRSLVANWRQWLGPVLG
jgi:hypothetical protein